MPVVTRSSSAPHGVPTVDTQIDEIFLNLTVTNLRGDSFALEVMMGEATSSIAVLKKLIGQVEGTPAERQLLAYKPEDDKGEGEGEGDGYLNDDVVVKQSCCLIMQRGSINFAWDLDSPLFRTTTTTTMAMKSESESDSLPSSPQADDPCPVFDMTSYATVRRVGPGNGFFHHEHTLAVIPPMDLVPDHIDYVHDALDLDTCTISLRIREMAFEATRNQYASFGRAMIGLTSSVRITPNCGPTMYGPIESGPWILQLQRGELVPTAIPFQAELKQYPLDSVVTMQLDRKESLLTFWVNGKRAGEPRRTNALIDYVVDRHCAVQWVVNAARRHTTISIVDDPVLLN
jgi:hypothetical protein